MYTEEFYMMYHGDGSYKPEDYDLEQSLLSLLTLEDEKIDKLNSVIRAYDKAKKSGMKTLQHINDINKAKEDIEAVRDQIRNYLVNKLDIDVNIL